MANAKKKLYTGTCVKCGNPVTITVPNKQTTCWRCRGWKSKNAAVDKPKQAGEKDAPHREPNVLQNLLRTMKFKEKTAGRVNETA